MSHKVCPCRFCGSTNNKKWGRNSTGGRRIKCRNCGRTFTVGVRSGSKASGLRRAVQLARRNGVREDVIMATHGITRQQLRDILSYRPAAGYTTAKDDLLTEGYTPEEIARHFGK